MSNFTEEEDKEFARLLRQVAENGYYFPDKSYHVLEWFTSQLRLRLGHLRFQGSIKLSPMAGWISIRKQYVIHRALS